MPRADFDPTRFIDREFEQELFEDLMLLRTPARILGIRDGGGMGKSHLLERFQYRCRTASRLRIPVSLLELDQIAASPLVLVGTIVAHLERFGVAFPTFRASERARVAGDIGTISAITRLEGASFEHARQTQIAAAMFNAERVEAVYMNSAVRLTDEQESVARGMSLQAFFRDLRAAAEQTIVLLFDAYEKCPPALQSWIEEDFLEQTCFALEQRPARLVVVIAGRELPHFERIWSVDDCQRVVQTVRELGRWTRHHVEECLRLYGLSYEQHHIEFFHDMVQNSMPPSQIIQVMQMLADAQRRQR